MLRDRLDCGVNDERIQRRLLAKSQLDFKKAMELATAMETADKNTRDLQNGNPSARENSEEQPVNRVTKDPPERSETATKEFEATKYNKTMFSLWRSVSRCRKVQV